MSELRYPIGIQAFSKIIEEGYVYVDKTGFIRPLLSQGQFIFLSRPRHDAGRFEMDKRKMYMIGANFNENKGKRGLEYEIIEG